jgi:hypothetical protein
MTITNAHSSRVFVSLNMGPNIDTSPVLICLGRLFSLENLLLATPYEFSAIHHSDRLVYLSLVGYILICYKRNIEHFTPLR